MSLEINNITVYYGKSLAIHEVSLEVPEGDVVSIIGANGAGKSTILKALPGSFRCHQVTFIFRAVR